MAGASAWAGTEPGYSHDSSAKTQHLDWMGDLPDSFKLSYLSVPGTHDTMAHLGGDAVQTQSMDLGTQLHSGIRAIDIRICFTLNTFLLSHGVVVQPGNFEDVMNTLTQFLSAHPREAVFMRVKQEEDFGGNSYTFEQVFESFWSRYSEFFWHGTGTNPSLGESRGKIVVLQDHVL